MNEPPADELLELRAKYQHAIEMHQQHSTAQLQTIKTAERRISKLTEEVCYLDAMVNDMQPCRLFHVALDVVEAELAAKDELLRWITALGFQHWPTGIEWKGYAGLLQPLQQLLRASGYTPEMLEKK